MRPEIVEIHGQNFELFIGLYASVFNTTPWNDQWTEEAIRERFETFVQFPRFHGLGYVVNNSPAAMVFGWNERWI